MSKEQKTKTELEEMIYQELGVGPLVVRVDVHTDPMGWHATPFFHGEGDVKMAVRIPQAVEQLRSQYDLKEDQ